MISPVIQEILSNYPNFRKSPKNLAHFKENLKEYVDIKIDTKHLFIEKMKTEELKQQIIKIKHSVSDFNQDDFSQEDNVM